MARTVLIPASYLPGGDEPSRADLSLVLVDRSDNPIPASDLQNARLFSGTHRWTITTEPLTIPVASQDDIHGETYYRVTVRQGSETWIRRVQVPASDGGTLTWADFVGLSVPVNPPASRLLPDPAPIPDGQTLFVADGRWVAGGLNGLTIPLNGGTRAQLDAAAAVGGLTPMVPYLVTDERRLAIALSPTSYACSSAWPVYEVTPEGVATLVEPGAIEIDGGPPGSAP